MTRERTAVMDVRVSVWRHVARLSKGCVPMAQRSSKPAALAGRVIFPGFGHKRRADWQLATAKPTRPARTESAESIQPLRIQWSAWEELGCQHLSLSCL